LTARPNVTSPPKPNQNQKNKKNSNAIKKMGRLILSYIESYNIKGKKNEGI
jgi:hypothetical protein